MNEPEVYFEVQSLDWSNTWRRTHERKILTIESAFDEYNDQLGWHDGPASGVRVVKLTMEVCS